METEKEEVLYTEEEVKELLQKEGDKRVSQALKKRDTSHIEKELEEKAAALEVERKQLELTKQFSEKGLPQSVVKYFITAEEEDLELFQEEWQKALEKGLQDKLGATSYKPQAANTQTTMTKEEFSKLSYGERLKLYKENPELFDKLSK